MSNIEIKPAAGADTRTGAAVARLARQLWDGEPAPPLLSSFSDLALAAALAAAPDLPRALLIENELPGNWESRLKKLRCAALNMNHEHVTEPMVRAVRSAGYKMGAYTVNDPGRARELLSWGCDAIFTDEMRLLCGLRRRPR